MNVILAVDFEYTPEETDVIVHVHRLSAREQSALIAGGVDSNKLFEATFPKIENLTVNKVKITTGAALLDTAMTGMVTELLGIMNADVVNEEDSKNS